ncbi:methyl-accepting chemotaxis protein [Brevibacillus sp. SYSU BS000544]|uniref:methyl-accepting chemotaxis protein n=1 Tax=Brevibacillus sp. SYSU BS000544 TaxID=3416443 RepID=UPI003CE4AF2C
MKQRSIATKVIFFITVVMAVFACVNGIVAYKSIQMTVEASVGRSAIHAAEHIAQSLDRTAYENFLKAPQEDATYWELREFLNDYREKQDALYVYTIQFKQDSSVIMIDGQPRASEMASPIGEAVSTTDPDTISQVLKGEASSSELIDDPKYGQYLSGYAPIVNKDGKVIGVLGVDIGADEVNAIQKEVILDNLPFMSGLLVVMALLALTSLSMYIRKRLLPLRELKELAEKMLVGDLRISFALNNQRKRRKDEIDVLSETFHRMLVDLQNLVAKIKLASSEVAAASEELTSNADECYQVTQQIATASSHMTLSEEEQLCSIREITRWVVQMSAVSNQIADDEKEVNEVTKQAAESSLEGMHMAREIFGQITELNDTVESAEKMISALGNRSHEIGTISSVITEIASQTNLLALNAAIESARAGEYGKGFAVVAGEVRLLAERSSESAKQISQLIEIIQRETKNAESFMKRGTEKVKAGLEKTRRVQQVFGSIQQDAGIVNQKVSQFSTSIHQLSEGSNQIVQAVQQLEKAAEQIACVSEQNAAGAEEQVAAMDEINNSAHSLAKLAADLTEVLDKFKV